MLKVNHINVAYGNLQVVWDVSLSISEGEVVAILGPNGAGKTTTLKSIIGLLPPKSGSVEFKGEDITGRPIHEMTTLGVAFVPEERNLFTAMTVHENLLMGAYTIRDKQKIRRNLEYVYSLFPRLEERRPQYAGTMSGGERQMLAIARGLMANPRLVLLDEPSMGLSPENVIVVFETIEKLRSENVTVIIVEQNVDTTLRFSDRAYVMEQGRIAMHDTSENLLKDDHVCKMYLGV
ncbi:ABC transporter ATP-binding protein [Desulfococcus sp.]|uniref:ABC transporter ATP-binding protein n=1 Tax=Desulfococcus sp. TaxID=2025834 RepID=UPI00359358A0